MVEDTATEEQRQMLADLLAAPDNKTADQIARELKKPQVPS